MHSTSSSATPGPSVPFAEIALGRVIGRKLAEARIAPSEPLRDGVRSVSEFRFDSAPVWQLLVAQPGTPLGNSFVFTIGPAPADGAPMPGIEDDRPEAPFRLTVVHRAGEAEPWTAQVAIASGYTGPHPELPATGPQPVAIDAVEAFRLLDVVLAYTKESGRPAA